MREDRIIVEMKDIEQRNIEICDLRRRLDDVTLRYLNKCQECETRGDTCERLRSDATVAEINMAGAIERYEREAMQNIKYCEALDKMLAMLVDFTTIDLDKLIAIAKQALEGGDGK
jgi:transcriptional regulator NrdR family protein